MSSNLMTNADNVSNAEMRKALTQALNENEELRSENEKLRETAQRMNGRMAALTEENEELRKERDNYKQQLEEAKEQHATELREVTEEMAAAARFSEKKWREHYDREERRLRGIIADVTAAALELPGEEAARQKLEEMEEAQRRGLQGRQWKASLKQVSVREAAWGKSVFATRGLSISKLRREHLGKGPGPGYNSYPAEESLYNLFLALRPGGPVDRFAMQELLKGKTKVITLAYNVQGQRKAWPGPHFTIPAEDAYELAACVLCHLPALDYLGFSYLPPLSTHSLEWVSHLPQCMERLHFFDTPYTVADLRELHRHRGSRTFHVFLYYRDCTDWGELAGVDDDYTRRVWIGKEFGKMVQWYQ